MACIKANSVDMTEILPISPNTLSYKIHLLGGGWVGGGSLFLLLAIWHWRRKTPGKADT